MKRTTTTTKRTPKAKRCWQCKAAVTIHKDGAVTCPNNCGPEALGKLFRF
jgi:hypothetical protein